MIRKSILLMIVIPLLSFARCDSITASFAGGWKPIKTAPRDGTVVEILETYGAAPWYGIFKWTRDSTAIGSGGKVVHFDAPAVWVSVDKPGVGVIDSECLFWRSYKETGKKYVDPTNGRQDTVRYWCSYLHLPYDRKTNRCLYK